MNSLTQTRIDVADTLAEAGLNAFASVPERAAPPLVGVMAGNPYVEDGKTFTDNTVRLVVRILLLPGDADVVLEQLEDVISKVVVALRNDQWSISVGELGEVAAGTANYPAVDITITNLIKIS